MIVCIVVGDEGELPEEHSRSRRSYRGYSNKCCSPGHHVHSVSICYIGRTSLNVRTF